MQNQAWKDALAIVLNGVANEPTLLNTLHHDILRKLILCVGTLDINQTVTIRGVEFKLKRVLEALNQHTLHDNRVLFSKCSHCEYVEVWVKERVALSWCGCGDCGNLICEKCTTSKGYCPPCGEYDDTECMYCFNSQKINKA